jgi:chromosome segregation ATPase
MFLKESAAMVARMKNVIAETGESSDEAQLKKMVALTRAFRKEYDSLKATALKKEQILFENKQDIKAIKKNNEATRERKRVYNARVKALEMKLNTVTIKITETEENRKNYALNIAHLKEEELERFHQLEGLRKQLGEYDAFCKKLEEMRLASLEEKDRMENELVSFQKEIKQFQSFIRDQIDKFESISTTSKERTEKRERLKEQRNKVMQEKIAARILKLNGVMDEKNKLALSMAQQLESVNERLRYFEKRFQQIASATGLTNPDAIINKYALKEEIKNELNGEIDSKKTRIDELKKELEGLRELNQQAKDAFVDSRWNDVHHMQNDLTKSDSRSLKNRRDADRLEQTLVYFQECLYNISQDIPPEFIAELEETPNFEALGSGGFNKEATAEALMHLESLLINVVEAVRDIEEMEDAKKEELKKIKASEDLLRSLPGFGLGT